jgi:hypothetical protein
LSTFGEWREKLENNKKLRPKKKNSFFTFLSWRPLVLDNPSGNKKQGLNIGQDK